jgi:hypothetical protein
MKNLRVFPLKLVPGSAVSGTNNVMEASADRTYNRLFAAMCPRLT